MGGEAESPRFSMARAANIVPFRVNIVYMLSVVLIGLLVPSDDDRLLGGSGVTASPFVIAVNDAGIPVVPDLLNAGMMVAMLSFSAEAIYMCSRILRTMSYQGLIPDYMSRVDSKGRPRLALLITCLGGMLLTYVTLSRMIPMRITPYPDLELTIVTGGGSIAINWLLSITSAAIVINWIIISFSSIRFHQAMKLQNDPLLTQIHAWRATAWPIPPVFLVVTCTLLAACIFMVATGDLVSFTNPMVQGCYTNNLIRVRPHLTLNCSFPQLLDSLSSGYLQFCTN